MRMRVMAIRTGTAWRTVAGILCESFCRRSLCGPISAGLAIIDEVSLSTTECSGAGHLSVSSIGQTIICLHSYNDQFLLQNRSLLCIRPSVDGLYRDGKVHISREIHKQCFITRREMTSRAPKPHRHRSQTFL